MAKPDVLHTKPSARSAIELDLARDDPPAARGEFPFVDPRQPGRPESQGLSVPTPELDATSAVFAIDPIDDENRLLVFTRGPPSIHEIALGEGPDGLEFSAPRLVIRLEEQELWDATHAGGDRFLGILVDPEESILDSVHVMIGGLDGLDQD